MAGRAVWLLAISKKKNTGLYIYLYKQTHLDVVIVTVPMVSQMKNFYVNNNSAAFSCIDFPNTLQVIWIVS